MLDEPIDLRDRLNRKRRETSMTGRVLLTIAEILAASIQRLTRSEDPAQGLRAATAGDGDLARRRQRVAEHDGEGYAAPASSRKRAGGIGS